MGVEGAGRVMVLSEGGTGNKMGTKVFSVLLPPLDLRDPPSALSASVPP